MSESSLVVYWDSSAAISLLFNDIHSETALVWWRKGTVHILSSLAYVEVAAVIARLERTSILDSSSTENALAKFTGLGWRKQKIYLTIISSHPMPDAGRCGVQTFGTLPAPARCTASCRNSDC